MTDKEKIKTCLRAFKNNEVDLKFTIEFMLSVFSESRRFNWANFIIGLVVGSIIGIIAKEVQN